MASWLRGTSWFQRIAFVLLLAAIGAFAYQSAKDANPSAGSIILALLLFFAFRRRLLWRVRNRLLITFFLFGVVPVFLIFWLLQLTAILVLGSSPANACGTTWKRASKESMM
jgi:hypothetical protein